jgi:predicted ester cyclase
LIFRDRSEPITQPGDLGMRAGNQVTVRGEAAGTPAGEFMGVPHSGKSFKLMSIDVHTLEGGKMVRSYHIEDWLGAVRQLSAK